ncbi:DrmB family protein [Microcella pacifica]|uniref:DUF1998 domain-containing protein n=1 Tax=Microcella pacifica TaxID=2591847 RepID=A0A9E5MFL6_9MICO|nr:DUF1998 domain-containing protein [Microcella pacifica]NHF63842.1 DUF1998 domain-containing protein [Microcella pacifica]
MSKRILQLGVAKLIAPFGPGAVVDILGESFMTLTADKWPKRTLLEPVDCLRLSSRLGIQRFYGPPTSDDIETSNALGIPVIRYPAWLFCQTCRRMIRWTSKLENGKAPECPSDSGRLVPMRFVVACRERSHSADVPWPEWLHRAPGANAECKENSSLRFRPIDGGSPGLSGLEVACDVCSSRRTLGDLRGDVLLREGLACHGTQPWESTWRTCESPLEVLQRGATSFHYAETEAAIDIPDVSASTLDVEDRIRTNTFYLALKSTPPEDPFASQMAHRIADELDVSVDLVLSLVRRDLDGDEDGVVVRSAILGEEFAAFRAAENDDADEENFKTRAETFDQESVDVVERALAELIESIVLVDRLREVRASLGFKRYRPDSDLIDAVTHDGTEAKWLPAYEGFGEGVFLRFNAAAMDAWASTPGARARSRQLSEKFDTSNFSKRLHPFSIQYVALHSFAHALLREFAFSSGYPAASLRERIYCEASGDYGVFIYTTSSDPEGTLGGLVREGELDRLGSSLARAAEQLSWCSNDPVCSESHPQNLDGLNIAACHSCLLTSETSCDGFNLLLDRVMLVGSPNGDVAGLLDGLLQTISDSM